MSDTQKPDALRLADELEMWTLGEPAAAELRRLHAENEVLRADAERYRWLRDKADGEIVFDHTHRQDEGGDRFVLYVPFDGLPINDDAEAARRMDAAIDAAMKGQS